MKAFILSATFILVSSLVFSQTNTDVTDDANQDLLTSEERARVNNLRSNLGLIIGNQEEDIRLTQMGDGNIAELQLIQTLATDRARLAVTQTGGVVGNNIGFQLEGSGLDVTILQRGDENAYGASLSGSAKTLDIVQDGFNNGIQHEAQLKEGAQIEFIQLGNDNFLNADGVGHTIQVTQRNGGRAILSELDN